MIKYGITNDEALCCGCRACELICKHSAIQMKKNMEGFLYPEVKPEACIECGLCNKVCPMENPPSGKEPEAAYALMNCDDDILASSSSGGVFRLLSDYVISKGGYVAGCIFDEDGRAVLTIADSQSECCKMQGSKYLSSDPGKIYLEIRDRLRNGKLVLFTGSPCQNAALIRFLQQPYENLITLDFLCHGMPSQQAFDSYKAYLEKKYRGHITDYKFRDKTYRGWGYTESFSVNSHKHYRIGFTSTYLFGFISSYLNRYSCYGCRFRGKRFTDFTISDYWGIKKHHNIPESDKGVSAVTINTLKAMNIFNIIKDHANCAETQIEWIAEENPSITRSHIDTIPQIRRVIYQEIARDGWGKVARSYLRCSNYYLKRFLYIIPYGLISKAKTIIRKG